MATDSKGPSAKSKGTSTGEAAREVAQEAGSTAKELGREALDQARSTAGYVRQQARTSIEESKNQMAEQVGGLAKAFHRGSEELRNDELGRLAEQSEWLAGRVEELQHYLQERDTSELLDDIRGVARRQPGWFLGGLFAAGMVTARFLHSSESSGSERNQPVSSYGAGGEFAGHATDTTRL